MRRAIDWAVHHSAAVNAILAAVLLIGGFCMASLRREEFPEFELEIILVSVPYPGASPEEIESGICQKIEEAVRALDGIKKVTTIASEGAGSVVLELESDVRDVQKVLAEVRSEVDRIPSFPLLAEDPSIQQITMRRMAIEIGLMGPETDDPESEWHLRETAEQLRDDLLMLPTVSNVEITGTRPFQIDVEISETTLREYGLTLSDVAQLIRRENMELPGGKIITESEEVLLRGNNKRDTGEGIADIPLITLQDGLVLTVGDLGTVSDDFSDITAISTINGRPGLVLQVNAGTREDLLLMTDQVKEFEQTYQGLPPGYELVLFGDRSTVVRDRLSLLTRNGMTGLVLVFLTLAIFLESRLALWVALGIPISILGAAGILLATGQTLNMLSMFSFLMVLGILVDDGIVIGENIHAHREMGKSGVQAAIDGVVEVFPSVLASIATTVVAFMPMFYVTGVMGKFFAVMPLAVIATLIISLFEATFALPCHLAHQGEEHPPMHRQIWNVSLRWRTLMRWLFAAPLVAVVWLFEQMLYPFQWLINRTKFLNKLADRFIGVLIERVYRPVIRRVLAYPFVTVAGVFAILMLAVGFVRAGHVPWIVFPRIDTNWIEAKITFPDGTPSDVTNEATLRIEQALYEVDERMFEERGEHVLEVVRRVVGQITSEGTRGGDSRTDGSHLGMVSVELTDTAYREITAMEIIQVWREVAGDFPGAEKVNFGTVSFGPGGRPVEFKVLADAQHTDQLEGAVQRCMEELGTYPGVFDIGDDSQPGKWEFQIRVRDDALAMGVTAGDLMETIRSSYYGDEVMRLQRGRHEVKLMVRYPADERRSLADFNELRVRTTDGVERPITELADIQVVRGYSEINRVDQMRSITVSADIDEEQANAAVIVADLEARFMPLLLEEFPDVRIRWEGQQEQTTESVQSLFIGFGVAMAIMYVLLAIEFNSYVQPLIVLVIIPFGMIGAIMGHWFLGLPLTLFSVLGLVALAGVVVNDSIVLLDFIKARVGPNMPAEELLATIEECGCRRLRPVMLTSITTVVGLLPIILETSLQAQLVIPMATSLAFGLMTTTFLVLFLLPAIYRIYYALTHSAAGIDDSPHPTESTPESRSMTESDDAHPAESHKVPQPV